MHIIIKDKELARLINSTSLDEHIYVESASNNINYLFTINSLTVNQYSSLLNENIPKEVLDKVKTLLTLGIDKFTAFESIKPYVTY